MSTVTTDPCPSWCTSDHTIDEQLGSPGWHYGQQFGPHITTGRFEGNHFGMLEDCQADDMSAGDLRQLAADALKAAEWLEAHQ